MKTFDIEIPGLSDKLTGLDELASFPFPNSKRTDVFLGLPNANNDYFLLTMKFIEPALDLSLMFSQRENEDQSPYSPFIATTEWYSEVLNRDDDSEADADFCFSRLGGRWVGNKPSFYDDIEFITEEAFLFFEDFTIHSEFLK